MTLSFSTTLNGRPTFFVEKIWAGLYTFELVSKSPDFPKRGFDFDTYLCSKPKIHTIRRDEKGRWREGMDIHMVIANRTSDRFQFAPVLKLKRKQAISIFSSKREIWLGENGREWRMSEEGVRVFAQNDGFNSVDDFFEYFSEDFIGYVFHWTDFQYN